MYIAELTLENFRIFGSENTKLTLPLRRGLTALVGENDTGKTAVVDALRFVLGTRDQEYLRIREEDFHYPSGGAQRESQIRIRCQFRGLTRRDRGAFAEYLTYVESGGIRDPVLYVNYTARNISGAGGSRRFIFGRVEIGRKRWWPHAGAPRHEIYCVPLTCGHYGMPNVRWRPAAGHGFPRYCNIRRRYENSVRTMIREAASTDGDRLSVLGVGDYASALLKSRQGIKEARKRLNENYLSPLSFSGNNLTADIDVKSNGDRETRLRQLLEKLELDFATRQGTVRVRTEAWDRTTCSLWLVSCFLSEQKRMASRSF